MKRSRAPSATRSNSLSTRQTRGSSSSAYHSADCPTTAFAGGGAAAASQQESPPSLEVDVGVDNLANLILSAAEKAANDQNNDTENDNKGAVRGRRRSTRGGPRKPRGETKAGSRSSTPTPDATTTDEANSSSVKTVSQIGASVNSRGHRGGAAATAPAITAGGANDSVVNGVISPSNGAASNVVSGSMNSAGNAAAAAEDNNNCVGKGPDAGGGGSSNEDGGGGDGQPPAKKPKKKYIRNPETHKVYRARMEGELTQARALLEDANKAMVELARDYKRQQAVIEKYRLEDNSLLSTSQLTQSQPTNQQQQQQLMQAQGQGLQQQHQQALPLLHQPQLSPTRQHAQQHQYDKMGQQPHATLRHRAGSIGGAAGGVAGAGGAEPPSSLEATLLGCSQDSIQEAEMSQLSQDVGMGGLSQASAFSLNMLDTEEPLSQVNNWIAAFQDSQEAWSLDEILAGDGGDADDNNSTSGKPKEEEEEREETPDSVEAVARAAEALSPSRQNQGMSPSRPLPPCSASTLSPMRPPPPQQMLPGGGRIGGVSPMRDIPPALLVGGPDGIVRVGVACLVTTPKMPGCVLIGKRKGSFGAGTLALPGGHLEVGEEWSACASREVLEETGLQLETPTFSWVINTPKMEGGKHYVTVFMLAAVSDPHQEPVLMEPDKCEGWFYMPWRSLGVRKSTRGGGGNVAGLRGWDRLFQPLAVLRATSYDPFRGVL